jgi:hypothetical protein
MINAFEILGALQEARIVINLARLDEASNADYDGAIERVDRALAALEKSMMTVDKMDARTTTIAECAAIVREHGTGYADRTEFLAKEIESLGPCTTPRP